MSSCANGHTLPRNATFCGICGAPARPASEVPARPEVTPQAARPGAPADMGNIWPATERILAGEEQASGFYSAPLDSGATTERPGTRSDGSTQRLTATRLDAGRGRPSRGLGGQAGSAGQRGRRIAITAGLVAVLAGGGFAAIELLNHHSTPPSTAAPGPHSAARAPSPTPASRTPSAAPPAAVGPAGWTYPKPIDQQELQNANSQITGISCVSPARCFAVDNGGNILASTAQNNWQIVDTDSRQVGLSAISCPVARWCVAVDTAGDAIIYNNGTWGDPVTVDSVEQLSAVSCPSTTFCVAVDGQGGSFVYTGSVRNWTRSTVDPGQGSLASVSCPRPGACVAVDQAGDVFTYNGSSWSADRNVDSGNQFVQVSCSGPRFCVAIDNNARAAVLSGGSWTVRSLPSTAVSVSCPTAGYCVAVDGSGGALVYQHGGWSKLAKIDGNNALAGVSCPTAAICTAADQYNNVMYYAQG